MRTIANDTSIVSVTPRLKIKDANGSWQDITNRMNSISYQDSIDFDSPTISCNFKNAYEAYVKGTNNSLDPNDPNSSYYISGQPLLGCKHEVMLEISKDDGSNWYEVFRGYVGPNGVKVNTKQNGDDTISADMVGLDYNLKSYYFTDDLEYEDANATSIAQQILTDHGFSQTIQLIDIPGYLVTYYRVKDTNLWDAIKKMIDVTGYVFRVKWYNGAFNYCVYDPDRLDSITSVDETFNGNFQGRNISVNEADVRTKIIVEYRDGTTGSVEEEESSDSAARAKYGAYDGSGGRKDIIMRYSTKEGSLIDTPGEAANLAAYILHDLKAPTPDVEIQIPFLYPSAEPHDKISFIGRDYTVDLGITGISWTLSANNTYGTTTISGTADRVIGQALSWLKDDEHSPDAHATHNQNSILGDGRRPDQVTGLTLYTDRTQNEAGQTVSVVWATWDAVSNWDLDHYEVWGRIVDRRGSSDIIVDDWRLFGVVKVTSYQFHGLPPGLDIDVKVYAVDWEPTTSSTN